MTFCCQSESTDEIFFRNQFSKQHQKHILIHTIGDLEIGSVCDFENLKVQNMEYGKCNISK